MRLVAGEAIWPTLQGEGVLVGTPITFVRLWGCDFSCKWCDTKDSWRPTSSHHEMSVDAVIECIKEAGYSSVSITGGNPLVQAKELAVLCKKLYKDGYYITLETQASIFDADVYDYVHVASLSPKLHDWRGDTLIQTLRHMGTRVLSNTSGKDILAQVKIVAGDEEETLLALEKFEWIHKSFCCWWPYYVITPEHSKGRRGVEVIHKVLRAWMLKQPKSARYPQVRIVPQVHKLALFVP